MSKKAITADFLNSVPCHCCGESDASHGELFLHSNCHRGAPTWVKYVKATRCLEISCSECRRLVAVVKVASHEEEVLGEKL